jgi:large subunit ribosomal protein L10
MNREEKSATIQEIAAQIEASEAIFAVDYRGISVSQAAELRGKLRENDASFRVVKNRLTKLAADQVGETRLAELLQGPTALTFVKGDTAAAAKAITTFNKEHKVLTYKGGFMEGATLDDDAFKSIAQLPSREVMIGQFAGVVASPLTGLVRGLGALIGGLALQLGQIAEQGLVTGEAPAVAADAPTAEAPAADAPAAEEAPAEEAPAAEPEAPAAEAETSSEEPAAEAEAPAGEEPATEPDAGTEDSDTSEQDSKTEEG